jgi:hypothetical protein
MNRPLIVCPFCPLHCDDMDAHALAQGHGGCALADSRMRVITESSLAVAGAADLHECREWIKSAKRVVISGDVIDWDTARAVSDFIAATGAETDGLGCDEAFVETFSREGAFTTTLGELSAREVSLLVIGEPAAAWPRINEKLAAISRRVDWSASEQLPQQLGALRRKLRETSYEICDEAVLDAFNLIHSSQYLVVLVAPSALNNQMGSPVQDTLLWSTLLGMIRELNQTRRAALLNFDRSLTVRSVLASRGTSAIRELPVDEETVSIQLSPYGYSRDNPSRRKIVIGVSEATSSPNVKWLPASVPGIHHPGIVIRGDGSVTLPLDSVLPASTMATPSQQLKWLMQG